MTVEQIAEAVSRLPGGWTLTNIVRHRDDTPRRFVARRSFFERDENGTPYATPTQQYESAVDPKDLIRRVGRRR